GRGDARRVGGQGDPRGPRARLRGRPGHHSRGPAVRGRRAVPLRRCDGLPPRLHDPRSGRGCPSGPGDALRRDVDGASCGAWGTPRTAPLVDTSFCFVLPYARGDRSIVSPGPRAMNGSALLREETLPRRPRLLGRLPLWWSGVLFPGTTESTATS